MSKAPETPPDDPAQSQRFIDMGREVEVDEDPRAFERAFKQVAHSKPPPRSRPSRAKSAAMEKGSPSTSK